jgi:hypothetical protein
MAAEKLNALAVSRAGPGLHGDGSGLWLFVSRRSDGSLSKRWAFRWRKHGRYGERSIGPYPAFSLKTAREEVRKLRADLKRGVDLAAQRQEEKAAALAKAAAPKPLTFAEATEQYIAMVGAKKWRPGGRHERQFRRSFELYVFSDPRKAADRGYHRSSRPRRARSALQQATPNRRPNQGALCRHLRLG